MGSPRRRQSSPTAFVAVSLAVHLTLFYALETAALKPEKPKPKRVELAIVHNEPPPPPPPPPPEPPKKKLIDMTKKVEVVKKAEPSPPAEPPPPPVFGVSLSSTTSNSG